MDSNVDFFYYTGYSSCERCKQKGHSLKGRMTFPKIRNLNLRTDHSFRQKTDRAHHVGDSPFLQIRNLDMVQGFPLDYLHLVLLGVMKRLMKLWVLGLKSSPFTLNVRGKRTINRLLRKIRRLLPIEFERKSISLDHLRTWKAQEFRTFLLYTGIK